MEIEWFMRLRNYVHSVLAVLFLLLLAYASISVSGQFERIPRLTTLTLPKVVSHMIQQAQSVGQLILLIQQVPIDQRTAILEKIIENNRLKQKLNVTVQDYINIIKQTMSPEISKPEMELLVRQALKDLNPCIFVEKSIQEIIPNEPNLPSAFGKIVMRELLKHSNTKLTNKKIKTPLLRLSMTDENILFNGYMLSPDDHFIATVIDNDSILVWDIKDNKPAAFFRLPNDQFTCLEWGSNNLLAAGAQSGIIYLWNINQIDQPEVRLRLPGTHALFTENFQSDEEFLKRQRNLSTEKLELLVSLENIHDQGLSILQGTNLLPVRTQSENGSIISWFIQRTPISLRTIIPAGDQAMRSIIINSNGSHLAAVSTNNQITVWNLQDQNKKIFSSDVSSDSQIVGLGLDDNARYLAYAPLESPNVGSLVIILDIKDMKNKAIFLTDADYGELNAHALSLSSDGQYIGLIYGQRFELHSLTGHNLLVIAAKTPLAFVNRGHDDIAAIFGRIRDDEYGLQSLVSCMPSSNISNIYNCAVNGNLKVQVDGEPKSFGQSLFASYEYDADLKNTVNIWKLPLDYLYGHFTWTQVQELLKTFCFQLIIKENNQ